MSILTAREAPTGAFGYARFALAFGLLTLSVACSDSNRNVIPVGAVDAPLPGSAVRGTLVAGGWALSEDGIQSVDLYIDRNFAGTTIPDMDRPDVAKIYPALTGGVAPGWKLSIDLSKVPPGSHELTFQARSRKSAARDLASFRVAVQP
jgi:hypothetical protein